MKHLARPIYLVIILMILLAACGPATSAPTAVPTAAGVPCLPSGDQTAINARLQGPDAVAVLCPGAVFELRAPVTISADGQKIYTEIFLWTTRVPSSASPLATSRRRC